jgi:hypothetical protein
MKARTLLVLLSISLAGTPWLPAPATAGPAIRRLQERKACKELASKLEGVSGNPQQAQEVYQQGVLKLIEQFGENPCGDIPAPTASTTPATAPATTTAPANPEQAQACQQFAAKLQAAQGNPAQAQQIYATGSQKLSSLYGPNACPNVPKP